MEHIASTVEAADDVAPSTRGTGGGNLSDQLADVEAEHRGEEKPQPKRHKVKVDGAELEVDEEELKSSYQLRQASNKRMEEAAKLRKEAETWQRQAREAQQFIDNIKRNPESLADLASQLGIDFDEIAERKLIQKFQLESMTPAERKAYELEKKVKEYENKEQETQKQADERDRQERWAQAQQALDAQIGEFLQTGQADPYEVEDAVSRMIRYAEAGRELSFKDAINHTRRLKVDSVTKRLESMTEEQIRALPKSFLEKVSKASLAAYKTNHAQTRQASAQKPRSEPKPKTTDDFFAELDKKFKLRG